jgi:hypothetical protein
MAMIAPSPSAPTGSSMSAPPFAAEVELAPAVREWLRSLPSVSHVVDEIDAGAGIADLVGAHAPSPASLDRPVIGDPVAVQVLELLQTPTAESYLRTWAPHGWSGLKQRVLTRGLDEGWLTCEAGNDPTYAAARPVADPFAHLIAVELKLRDWRRGIGQAGRYRLWAEETFVALPAARLSSLVLAEATRNRVGVLAVHGTLGHATVEVAAAAETCEPLQPQRRRWAAEQVLGALHSPSLRTAGAPIV